MLTLTRVILSALPSGASQYRDCVTTTYEHFDVGVLLEMIEVLLSLLLFLFIYYHHKYCMTWAAGDSPIMAKPNVGEEGWRLNALNMKREISLD